MFSAREGAEKVPCTWKHLTPPNTIAVGAVLGARPTSKKIIFW